MATLLSLNERFIVDASSHLVEVVLPIESYRQLLALLAEAGPASAGYSWRQAEAPRLRSTRVTGLKPERAVFGGGRGRRGLSQQALPKADHDSHGLISLVTGA